MSYGLVNHFMARECAPVGIKGGRFNHTAFSGGNGDTLPAHGLHQVNVLRTAGSIDIVLDDIRLHFLERRRVPEKIERCASQNVNVPITEDVDLALLDLIEG